MRTPRPSGASVNGEQQLTLQSHATSVPLPAGAPEWQAVPPLEDTEAIGPNEVLALPSNIKDGAILPASSAKPTAAPSGAEVELQDTAVPSGTEVLHVYSTDLNGSLPCDLPAEQSAATVHLRGAYGPSLSQMYADQGSKPASEADLPRALHAEYLEFCRCLLDEHGHRCWREMLVTLDISDPDAWVRYAAKYATLPPLPAQLALPAPVWSIVSSTVLLYLQPSLLAALAERMRWAFEPCQHTEIAMHFAGFSAGSYTAIALEVDYRLLCQHFQLPLCPGTTTVGALGCPVQYLLALLSPVFQPDSACLLSAQRALRISHVWEDILCVWRPKIDVLRALSAPLRVQDTRPALLIQVLDSGNTEGLDWLGKEKHNYGHLLRVTIPRNPALLVVKATLKDLAAYSADFVPPEALDTWASYLLSWAATIAPFDMLTAEQLLMAAASDDGALQAARILSRKQRGGDLTFATARQVLVQNVCRAITRAKEGQLISSIRARIMHTMAKINPGAFAGMHCAVC